MTQLMRTRLAIASAVVLLSTAGVGASGCRRAATPEPDQLRAAVSLQAPFFRMPDQLRGSRWRRVLGWVSPIAYA